MAFNNRNNLNPQSAPWGREVEQKIEESERGLSSLRALTENNNKATSATLRNYEGVRPAAELAAFATLNRRVFPIARREWDYERCTRDVNNNWVAKPVVLNLEGLFPLTHTIGERTLYPQAIVHINYHGFSRISAAPPIALGPNTLGLFCDFPSRSFYLDENVRYTDVDGYTSGYSFIYATHTTDFVSGLTLTFRPRISVPTNAAPSVTCDFTGYLSGLVEVFYVSGIMPTI